MYFSAQIGISAIGTRVFYHTNWHLNDRNLCRIDQTLKMQNLCYDTLLWMLNTSRAFCNTNWRLSDRNPFALRHNLPSQILELQALCYVQCLDAESEKLCRCKLYAVLRDAMSCSVATWCLVSVLCGMRIVDPACIWIVICCIVRPTKWWDASQG